MNKTGSRMYSGDGFFRSTDVYLVGVNIEVEHKKIIEGKSRLSTKKQAEVIKRHNKNKVKENQNG